jgi:hypothetical protein|nr:MAG TPA: hypothetical protein [Caudoviricetes sp.]
MIIMNIIEMILLFILANCIIGCILFVIMWFKY